jgi:pimeloyl-ACP methyl ester carboxylesterase
MSQTSTIVVFLPGTTGSNLVSADQPYNTLTPVWRSQILGDLTADNVQGALSALNGTLYPGIPYGAQTYNLPPLLQLGYGAMISFFTSQLGFQYISAQAPAPGRPDGWGLPTSLTGDLLIGFGYDWRADNSTIAQSLRNLLSTIDSLYGASYQLYLLAHSMGGLVSRAYLEASSSTGDPWYSKIKGLITLGTPHLGAPMALNAIIGDWTDFNPSPSDAMRTLVHAFVDDGTSDSTYELLPPPSQGFLTVGGSSYSIFDAGLPSALQQLLITDGLSTGTLSEALTFLQSLNYQGTPALPPYYCVYGSFASDTSNQNLTCQSFTYTDGQLTEVPTHDGDLIVPASSAMFSGRTTPLAGLYEAPNVWHGQLPHDPGVLQQVAQWMGLE